VCHSNFKPENPVEKPGGSGFLFPDFYPVRWGAEMKMEGLWRKGWGEKYAF
jgi:hypothetical protein